MIHDPSYGTAPVVAETWANAELAYQNQVITWLYNTTTGLVKLDTLPGSLYVEFVP